MSGFWLDVLSNSVFVLLGAALSLYATIVFERNKRYGEILRDIAQARVHAEGYPISQSDLARAYQRAVDYWKFLEGRQWALDAEGQHRAAGQVGRLVSFAFRTTACLERMVNDRAAGRSVDAYLTAFQSEYGRIKDREFLRFEENIRPSIRTMLLPLPQPVLPRKREAILVDFFDNLL